MPGDNDTSSSAGVFTFGILSQDGSQVSWSSVTVFVPGDDPEVVLLARQQALDVTLTGRRLNGLSEKLHLGILPQHLVTNDVTTPVVQGVRPGEHNVLLGHMDCLQVDHRSRNIYRDTVAVS